MPTPSQDTRPILVKIGGSMMDDEAALSGICLALSSLHASRQGLVLVHGGGKDINRHLAWLDEVPRFVDGLRVTSRAAMRVVEMTLSGYVNKKLVGLLGKGGGHAAGISGVDGNTLACERISAELGEVGRVTGVDTALVAALLAGGFLPVMSPVSMDASGTHYNVNADDAASALAVALKAAKLIFVSDVEGVRGKDGARLDALDGAGIEGLIADGTASGGMIPKLRSCQAAVGAGIGEVHICKWEGALAFAAQVKGEGNTGTIIRG